MHAFDDFHRLNLDLSRPIAGISSDVKLVSFPLYDQTQGEGKFMVGIKKPFFSGPFFFFLCSHERHTYKASFY